ncbi:putative aminoacyltransferase, E1 ubiquitin-activating enzyme [Rosa chinensis]|uniref:E2 ubiquitin-conjugating enzyme n=2 Tax=Rosa chinensis TaxID=74649 RepID=A0A2P6QAS8_ROSCH|nr:probable ubiquitin-conjugating enzyme E2 26 isoform X1 [Rosa chinensis]PRQ31288.1 putative aminoacyltransferase, E1 ubiquitin-activating enzyme [Rosa chinensis]
MDTDDVVEVAAPVSCSRKLRKNKEVNLQDVIELDKDDSAAAMFIYEKIDRSIKGKAVENSSDGYHIHQSKEAVLHTSVGSSGMETLGSVSGIEIAKDVAPASNHFIDLDGPNSDASADDVDDCTDTCFEEFDYAFLQSHFDNVGIPPGVEAPVPHIPWLSDPPKSNVSSVSGSSSVDTRYQMKSDYVGLHGNELFPWTDPPSFNFKPTVVGSSSLKTQTDSIGHPNGQYQSSWKLPKAARSRKKQSASHPQVSAPSLPVGAEPSKSQRLLGALQRKKKLFSSSSSTNYDAMKFDTGAETSFFGHNLPYSPIYPHGLQSPWLSDSLSAISAKPNHSSFYGPIGSIYPPGELVGIPWVKGVSQTQHNVTAASLSTTPARQLSSKEIDEIMQKYKGFKQFDTVEDHSDHHYILSGTLNGNSMTQPPKNWAKRIQEEWKSLEKDLPDTVFVRVYETRMDLLRAVIVGAEGTPYHDGLFFFDVSFPSGYPNVPPHVHYHSGGLRLNPNLYGCGKVCLSLLNTWSGNSKEMWIPGVSTILQVLVSIQGLILNTKPYFNEPGYASMNGSAAGETRSQQYNEDTFLLSLTTMVYMMRRPPKHFEDFVVGHFRDRAHDILVACKAYMDGAQVGCLVKGGVQDVDEGDKSCSQRFKDSLAGHMPMLVKEFTHIGVKDCEKYVSAAVNGNEQIGSMPQAATSMVSC